jgi:hypothetical protein
MRHALRIHQQELMNQDRLSEVVLIVVLVVFFALLLAIIRDLAVGSAGYAVFRDPPRPCKSGKSARFLSCGTVNP